MQHVSAPAPITAPRLPLILGLAGLLPQIAVVIVLLSGRADWRFSALALGYAYAALILSFLGGLWWGLAARAPGAVPAWVWIAAIVPSLVALQSAVPWAVGEPWPQPSLVLLGAALLLALVVDHRLWIRQLAPSWWLRLRVPLSTGLGLLTLAAAWL